MNWYKKYLSASAKKIVLPQDVYDNLEDLARKISKGHTNWSPEDLQLQSNHPEALEWFLRKLQKEVNG